MGTPVTSVGFPMIPPVACTSMGMQSVTTVSAHAPPISYGWMGAMGHSGMANTSTGNIAGSAPGSVRTHQYGMGATPAATAPPSRPPSVISNCRLGQMVDYML